MDDLQVQRNGNGRGGTGDSATAGERQHQGIEQQQQQQQQAQQQQQQAQQQQQRQQQQQQQQQQRLQVEAQTALLVWISAEGGGSSKLAPFYEEAAGTGLALRAGCGGSTALGEELLRVPACCLVTPLHGMATPWGQAVLRAGRHQELGGGSSGGHGNASAVGRAFMAVALAHARVGALRGVGGGEGGAAWHAYASTMPTPSECGCFPERWSAPELALLGAGEGLARRAAAARVEAAAQLALIRECMEVATKEEEEEEEEEAAAAAEAEEKGEEGGGEEGTTAATAGVASEAAACAAVAAAPSLTDEAAWAWARCMVSSRCFTNPAAVGRPGAGTAEAARRWRAAVSAAERAAAGALPPHECASVALAAFDSFLVPFADLANHTFGPQPAMAWDFCERRRAFIFEAAVAMPTLMGRQTAAAAAAAAEAAEAAEAAAAAAEATDAAAADTAAATAGARAEEVAAVHISYGRKTVADLLLHYGFCPSAAALARGAMVERVVHEIEVPVYDAAGVWGASDVDDDGGSGGGGGGGGDGNWAMAVRYTLVGVGPSAVQGVDGLLELLREQAAAASEAMVADRATEELFLEVAALRAADVLVAGRLTQAEAAAAAAAAAAAVMEVAASGPSPSHSSSVIPLAVTEVAAPGAGGGDAAFSEGSGTVRGSVAAVLLVTLDVCAALRAFLAAALALLASGNDESALAAALVRLQGVQPGGSLGAHAHRDLKRYARGRLHAWADLGAAAAPGTAVAAAWRRLEAFVGPRSSAAPSCGFGLFDDILSSSEDDD
jgi:hypothetical protein